MGQLSRIFWSAYGLTQCLAFFFPFLKRHLFFILAVVSLRHGTRAFSSCGEWGPLPSCGAVASLVVEHRLSGTWALSLQLTASSNRLSSCGALVELLMAHGIFPDQGSSQRPLRILNHWIIRETPPNALLLITVYKITSARLFEFLGAFSVLAVRLPGYNLLLSFLPSFLPPSLPPWKCRKQND